MLKVGRVLSSTPLSVVVPARILYSFEFDPYVPSEPQSPFPTISHNFL